MTSSTSVSTTVRRFFKDTLALWWCSALCRQRLSSVLSLMKCGCQSEAFQMYSVVCGSDQQSAIQWLRCSFRCCMAWLMLGSSNMVMSLSWNKSASQEMCFSCVSYGTYLGFWTLVMRELWTDSVRAKHITTDSHSAQWTFVYCW